MPTRHTITHADKIYTGDVSYGKYSPDGRRGLEVPHLYAKKFGAIVTADADGVAVNQGNVEAGLSITIGGALASGGVATMDVPRNVTIYSTGNESGSTFLVSGTDEYGETLTERITGPNNGTATGKKAFKTVTSVVPSASTAIASTVGIDVGSGVVYGYPVVISSKDEVLGVFVDGKPETTLTLVVGDTTAATATTGDVRGTWSPNTAANSSLKFSTLQFVADHSTKELVFGVTQA